MKTIVLFAAGLIFYLFLAPQPNVSAENGRKLTSFKTGFFYASISKDEGMVQLSECADLAKEGGVWFKKPFMCVPDGNGFRCTTNDSLDVVFVFKNMKECNADRDKTLNSEEE